MDDMRRARAERNAHADLPRALRHDIREHTVDANGGERQREQAENGRPGGSDPRWKEPQAQELVERNCLEPQVRIERRGYLPKCASGRGGIGTRPNDQVQSPVVGARRGGQIDRHLLLAPDRRGRGISSDSNHRHRRRRRRQAQGAGQADSPTARIGARAPR